MAASLRDNSRAGVDEDDCQVCRRAAGNHVTGILFVSRSIGYDKLTVVGREITVSYVDGNTLLPFSLQSVEQQSIVNVFACVAHPFAVALQSVELVFIQFLAVE